MKITNHPLVFGWKSPRDIKKNIFHTSFRYREALAKELPCLGIGEKHEEPKKAETATVASSA